MKIILASASPRRRELLDKAGLEFEIRPSPGEEIDDASLSPDILCETNATIKARAVEAPGCAIIGADTLVFIDSQPLGKPADLQQARTMLRQLSGRDHAVCTGVCLIHPNGETVTFHEITKVRFHELTDQVIDDYVSKVDPLDKAGAYGIQEFGEMLVKSIEGGFDNVMGLPVDAVLTRLRACG